MLNIKNANTNLISYYKTIKNVIIIFNDIIKIILYIIFRIILV